MFIKYKICRHCHKTFATDDYRIEYCSNKCRTKARNIRQLNNYHQNIKPNKPHTKETYTANCMNPKCGKLFIKKACNQVYCSTTCRRAVETASYHKEIKERKRGKVKYSISDIALIERYHREILGVIKHYGIISHEIKTGKEYDLNEIKTALRIK